MVSYPVALIYVWLSILATKYVGSNLTMIFWLKKCDTNVEVAILFCSLYRSASEAYEFWTVYRFKCAQFKTVSRTIIQLAKWDIYFKSALFCNGFIAKVFRRFSFFLLPFTWVFWFSLIHIYDQIWDSCFPSCSRFLFLSLLNTWIWNIVWKLGKLSLLNRWIWTIAWKLDKSSWQLYIIYAHDVLRTFTGLFMSNDLLM